MNSEISNVLKLAPLTVVKTDKQTDEKSFSSTRTEANQASSAVSALQSDSTASSLNSKQDEDKQNDAKVTLDTVKQAADQGNSLLQAVTRNLQFKVDDSTQELVVKIVDSETGDVVRQIPSEEMLAFIRRMQELDGHQGSVIQDRA
ncbi:flagellar protein FlaG [Methylomonas sp. MED-D]|uniref:Flagellar biosynthesis protein FlaG n=1 Tax=Methylomonas koyamae TaxID=702114 RepID=A0A177NBJ4_9GAMM|nr:MULTISPECIES: flagellar protein FlaG [Methylomonas]NJA07716.1 flagellar protein FlaG [Methylococcaceae bacterium WWC4]MDT4332512.1 flagellar protein FlaG [Methylomonas sp. MV1]OAI15255.1 flagellar biosynthesis protein FlaG [Methylomonas koyamae]OHX34671.1 flagellar biosynthesis protein FlaG [Methylomonas sp. LWB]WGS85328.1 flagellar protein FlaG [Methylomonas sp. UP202]